MIKKDADNMCDSPEESLAKVIDTHFPGNNERDPDSSAEIRLVDIGDPKAAFLSVDQIKTAASLFDDHKAPGPDGFCPVVLKHLGIMALSRLSEIYKASFLLGHVPRIWRTSKVIFIPKAGKKDYSEARSFRPISLSSFMLKTMERVVLWHMNETTFKTNPLSRNQHAFRPGFSTETALTNMVNSIETAFGKKHEALGVFLDIQGAFDNVDPHSIVRCMKKRGFDNNVIEWYKHYLLGRRIHVDHKGVRIDRALTRGVPQGGVLSPIAWNLVFDELLDLYKVGSVRATGFADDAGLLITGNKPREMMEKMQRAVNKAIDWGNRNGLSFSAPKTVVVWFSRKRKPQTPPKLRVNDTQIPFSEGARYLGVELDTKLAWSHHVKLKIAAAKQKLLRLRNSMGKLWGITPLMTRWIYTGIIRPALTYGALVWARTTEAKGIQNSLTRVNRLAVTALGNFRRSTPTAGLEVICNITPLPLHIQYEACLAWYRTQSRLYSVEAKAFGKSVGTQPHRKYLREMIETLELPIMENDRIPLTPRWDKEYFVDKNSFEKGAPSWDATIDYEIYTDGSGFRDHFGAGMVVYKGKALEENTKFKASFHLGLTSSVYQGEMAAIKEAAIWLKANCSNKRVVIYSDSRSSLLSLTNPMVKSELVFQTRDRLTAAASKNNYITLRWVKAHADHFGNEVADELAKGGALGPAAPPSDLIKPPLSFIKHSYSCKFRAKWAQQWHDRTDCRQTKLWFEFPNRQRAFEIINLDRFHISAMIRTITGHNYLKRHQALVDNTTDNLCTFCQEAEETSIHVVAQCEPLWRHRQDAFGSAFLSSPLLWNVSQTISFLREASIDGLLTTTQEE